MKDKILVVAAHPDDEVIGMGGTISYFVEKGIEVTVLFLSSGVGSRTKERQSVSSRKISAKKSLKILGCSSVSFGNFPDNEFDTNSLLTVVKYIEQVIEKLKPNIVFTNFYNDLNIDHQMTSKATQIAVRPKTQSSVESLFYFEVTSSTGWSFGSKPFVPNYFIDISTHIEKKFKALHAYQKELNSKPNARSLESIKAIAQSRGMFVGYNYAEAFEIGFIKVDR